MGGGVNMPPGFGDLRTSAAAGVVAPVLMAPYLGLLCASSDVALIRMLLWSCDRAAREVDSSSSKSAGAQKVVVS